MSAPATLYEHARRLHRAHPDAPLPRCGEPFPGEQPRTRVRAPADRRREGADVAAILDAHFADPTAKPRALSHAFREVYVGIHENDHITAAARRADRERVRKTGRWLVRHGTDTHTVTVGLALLATDWWPRDRNLIRTIGLLSTTFGPLAAVALRNRRAWDDLLWLTQRTTGWGRVYLVETLCAAGSSAARPWLLRNACDGDALNGYFAGQVATAFHLHAAITATDVDDALIDHTGRLLHTLTSCRGMGLALDHYPPAAAVLDAYSARLIEQSPTQARYLDAAFIADHLLTTPPEKLGFAAANREVVTGRLTAVLHRDDWIAAADAETDPDNEFFAWFRSTVATRLDLPVFAARATDTDVESREKIRNLQLIAAVEAPARSSW